MKARTEKLIGDIKRTNPELFSNFYPELFYLKGKNGLHEVKLVEDKYDRLVYICDHYNYISFDEFTDNSLVREDLKDKFINKQTFNSFREGERLVYIFTFDKTLSANLYNSHAKELVLKIHESEKVKKSNKISNITFKKGKYKGVKVGEVINIDKQYCEWVINNWNYYQNKSLFNSIKGYLNA